MYYDSDTAYPEPKEKLGRGLGPAIDIGPAMTAKILKYNGQIIYRSTYRAFNRNELEDPKHIDQRAEFDAAIKDKLGSASDTNDIIAMDPDSETPEYDLYQDDF
jgi:hypothetical protein